MTFRRALLESLKVSSIIVAGIGLLLLFAWGLHTLLEVTPTWVWGSSIFVFFVFAVATMIWIVDRSP